MNTGMVLSMEGKCMQRQVAIIPSAWVLVRLIVFALLAAFQACGQNSGYSYMTYYFSDDGSRLYATTVTSGQMLGGSGSSHIYTAYTNISGPTQSVGCGTASSGWVPAQNYNTISESCYVDTDYPGNYVICWQGTAYCTDVGRTYYDTGLENSTVSSLPPPAYMLVKTDYTRVCTICSSTVSRSVQHQVMRANGLSAGTIAICENVSSANWNCSQNEPTLSTLPCSGYPGMTASDGTFTDNWSLNSDSYTPVGCGWGTIIDRWMQPRISGIPAPFGTPQGYIHTDQIKINGVVSPAQLPPGTIVNP